VLDRVGELRDLRRRRGLPFGAVFLAGAAYLARVAEDQLIGDGGVADRAQ